MSNFLVAFGYVLLGVSLERVAQGVWRLWWRRRQNALRKSGIYRALHKGLNRDLAKRHASGNVRIPVQHDLRPPPTPIPGLPRGGTEGP